MEIEMSIKGLMVDPITNMPIIVLREVDGQRVLPIWVGVFEANANMAIYGPGDNADLAYKKPYVDAIVDSFDAMIDRATAAQRG